MQIQQYHYLPIPRSVFFMNVRREEGHRAQSYHMHDHEEIVLVESECACRIVNNGNRVEVNGPMIVLNRVGTFHETDTVLKGDYRSRVLFFHPQNLQDLPEEMRHSRLFADDMLILPLTQEQLAQFTPLFDLLKGRPMDQKRLILLCVLSQIELLIKQGVRPITTNAHHNYIFDVIEAIQASSEQYTMSELAERFHVSKSKLRVDFQRITGESVAVFSRRVRMQKAKSLLETTNLEIAQIAQRCGFSDESYFIGSFRKTFGITPGAYRRGK